MHMVDISFLIYVLVALIVGVCWAIFRERPNGHYSTPEEGVFMSAALIGALWPFELIGIAFLIALVFWQGETRWQK